MYYNRFHLIIFYYLIHQCLASVFIYNTEDQVKTDSYDCIPYTNKVYHLQSIKYCIRTNESMELQRIMNNGTDCLNNGKKYDFYSLKNLGIQPMEVLNWNSGIELADSYAAYLNRSVYDHFQTIFLRHCKNSNFLKIFVNYFVLLSWK